jgi:hypothetical protein
MLTTEELLRDRIKIIADYPGNKFKVGDILTYSHNFLPTMTVGVGNQIWRNQEGVIVSYNKFKDFPHLFQPLPWWSDREISDMPVFIKFPHNGRVYKISKWSKNIDHWNMINVIDDKDMTDLFASIDWHFKKDECVPCTEADYEAYNQQKEGLK